MHHGGAAQLTLALRRFLGEDVTVMGLRPLEATRTGTTEALGRIALGFDFRHFNDSPRLMELYDEDYGAIPNLLFALRADDHDHLFALHLGVLFDRAVVGQIFLYTLQQFSP